MIKALLFFLLGSICAWLIELPFGGWFLILGLAFYIYFIFKEQRVFLFAWLFGLGYFCNALWWIYVSLHEVGQIAAPISVLAVVALSSYLALFPAIAIKLVHQFHSSAARVLGLASSWVIMEWVRGQLFTGFPWAGLAESQVDGPFFAWATIFGGLACAWFCVGLAAYLSQGKHTLFTKFVASITIISASHALGLISFTEPIGRPIDVTLIQGNFPQSLKFDPEYIQQQVGFYTNSIKSSDSQLVIAPETAFPVELKTVPQELISEIKPNNAKKNVILGVVSTRHSGLPTNSAIGLNQGNLIYQYDKSHLVPFGEFIPWGFQWFVDLFKVPLGNFERGSMTQTPYILEQGTDQIAVGLMICYEDVFGDELAKRQRNSFPEHHLWINLTNLAWFGESQAPEQQLRLARLRSIETGIPTLRATNTGVTAVINSQGQVVSQLPKFQQATLKTTVQAYSGKTPYVWLGDLPILIISALFLVFAWYQNKK
uniref:apolipoprotein N-acyltransferase n=1 Tax=Polynucleobacter sp. TaxID=2029855 RepID=UPI004048BACA